MGHRSHQSSILENGGAAHSLDNAACLFQQSGICHLDGKTFVGILLIPVNGGNLDLIFFRGTSGRAQQGGRPFPYLLPAGDFHLAQRQGGHSPGRQGSVDSHSGIGLDLADLFLRIVADHALQFSRNPILPFHYREDIRLVQLSLIHLEDLPHIYIADPVSQGAEASVFLHIGEGSDALDIIPHPDAQLIGTIFRLNRSQFQIHLLSLAPDFQHHILSAAFSYQIHKLLLILQRAAVHPADIVTGFYNVFRGTL